MAILIRRQAIPIVEGRGKVLYFTGLSAAPTYPVYWGPRNKEIKISFNGRDTNDAGEVLTLNSFSPIAGGGTVTWTGSTTYFNLGGGQTTVGNHVNYEK